MSDQVEVVLLRRMLGGVLASELAGKGEDVLRARGTCPSQSRACPRSP